MRPANELYLADGYGNHRVMVIDADTFALQADVGRLWQAAVGRKHARCTIPASPQFANPVHCVKIASDGLVYVCDRSNNRIQVFQKNGTFVKEFVYDKDTQAIRLDLGHRAVARQEQHLSGGRRRHEQFRPRDPPRRRPGAEHVRHRRAAGRPIPLGACDGDRLQGQSLYRRSRHRKAHPEIHAQHDARIEAARTAR